ncbi:MAG TPA: response regulator [Bdellovibrionales bacterium]|nr:response regulator [Bdellovibrionales bacterium]
MGQQKKHNILLVDDEGELLESLSFALAKRGYNVIRARSGNKAYQVIEERRKKYGRTDLSVIVSDWMMPDGDGIGLLATVRGKFPNENIPFVLTSGVVTPEKLESAIKLDADAVLLKPFSISSLILKIEEAIRVRLKKDFERAFPEKAAAPKK